MFLILFKLSGSRDVAEFLFPGDEYPRYPR
jgi:hypothetical protein